MSHTCNPSNSGGKDQEDRSSKPAWPYLKKPFTHTHKKAGGVAQSVGPEFKHQYLKKKKKEPN
jgi:hypothetical protein